MSRLGLALRLAVRDLRGSARGFGVFLACIALGVAAVAAVGNLNNSVADALNRDARRLLGGDMTIEQANVPLAPDQIAALAPQGSVASETIRMSTVARAPGGRSVAVTLKAVDGAHPLVGEVALEPESELGAALAGDGVAVEPALLARLGVAQGDRIRMGDGEVRLAATIVSEPDRLGGAVSIGPRVLLSTETLRSLGLVRPGSLVRFEYRFAFPPGIDADAHAAALPARFPDAGWRVETASDVQPQVARLTDRLATFLTLAGLAALITGGLGIGLAVQSHLARRVATIATFKCLGADGSLIFRVYLLQLLLLAAAGVGVGLVVGQLLPLAAQLLPEGAVPIVPDYAIYVGPLLLAAACGFAATFVFALWPLAMAREVTPATLFRSFVAPAGRGWPRPRYLMMLVAAIGVLAALTVLGVPQRDFAGWFLAGTAACLATLALLARGLIRGLARLRPLGGFAWRMALGAIERPGSGAKSVIVALGTGLAVLTMVALLERNLSAQVEVRLPSQAPSTLFIDIQPQQRETFAEILRGIPGARLVQELPSLRARVVRLAGEPVSEASVAPEVRWTVGRDRGLTYLARQPGDVTLVEGGWWPADYQGPPLVSIDAEIAQGYGVGVGDTIGFSILGRTIEATIANLRDEVDWSTGRLDFMFIMSPGLLDKAPHSFVASVDVPPGVEPRLLNETAERLPNVTPISIRDVVAQLSAVLRKIGFAVDAVAGVTLLAGLLVLAAAVAAARQRHLYESVLLKVLGATRGVVLKTFLVEYGILGAASALVGAAVGSVAAYAIVTQVMDLTWRFAPFTVAGIGALAVGLALVVGGLGLWRLLTRPPAPVLRGA